MTKSANAYELLFNKPSDLEAEVLRLERARISEALAKVNGKVTHAADLLGLNYQKLAYIIETRHPDLLKKRTPVRRRPTQSHSQETSLEPRCLPYAPALDATSGSLV